MEHTVEELLKVLSITDINTKNILGNTVLQEAAYNRHVNIVQSLLRAGADYHIPNTSGSALDNAVRLRSDSIVDIILQYDQHACLSSRAIDNVISTQNKALLERHFSAAPDTATRAAEVAQVLRNAAKKGKTKIVQSPFNNGADVNLLDQHGRSVLCEAVRRSQAEAVSVLLNLGADPSVTDMDGSSPLLIAAESQELFDSRLRDISFTNIGLSSMDYDIQLELIEWFVLSKLSDDDIKDQSWYAKMKDLNFWIALGTNHLALSSRPKFVELHHEDLNNPVIINTLLDHGANISERTEYGESMLHLSVNSAPRITAFLARLDSRPTLEIRNCNGRTALHYAAAACHSQVMRILLEAGAEVMAKDHFGVTTLHFASKCAQCTSIAIEKGCSPNERDHRRRTSYHYAAMVKETNLKVMSILEDSNVDIKARDVLNKTADDYYQTGFQHRLEAYGHHRLDQRDEEEAHTQRRPYSGDLAGSE